MDNSLKGLILAAGTIITCVVISLGFFIAREAKDTASNGANQINKLNSEFVESDKVIYDGAMVYGSEVVNVIKKFKDEKIGIFVKTNRASAYYNNSFDVKSGEFGEAVSTQYDPTDIKSEFYVNPYVNFQGKIVRDENEVITGIIFEQ